MMSAPPAPPSLLELQRWMKSHIRAGEIPVPAGAHGAPSLNPQRSTPGVERLAVYADGYLVRVHEALSEVYEAIAHVLGAKQFTELSRRYAQRYPSHDYNLSFVGRHLPDFLAASVMAESLPFLPDLAGLEWRVCRAFHAYERPPLDRSSLADVPLEDWDRALVAFQPSVGLAASAWPILDIWTARTQSVKEVNVDLVDRPQRVLVFRQGETVSCELVDEPQYTLLKGLLAGETMGGACRALAECSSGHVPADQWFARWMRLGLIVRCDLAGVGAGSRMDRHGDH